MTVSIPPGVFDIIPYEEKEQWRQSYLWEYVETEIRKLAKSYGFQEIRTPIFESTKLFLRSVGEETDIVSKEMYTFEDKGGRSMSLRPEGTAAVMRAYIENQMHLKGCQNKLFYIGPMFRYERAQAGRYRQHHQFGAEVVGNGSPEQDAELIDFLYTLYRKLGLKNLSIQLNSIGDRECRERFKQALLSYLEAYFTQLSEDSQRRFHKNPLRILDSKNPQDKQIVSNAPVILDFLSPQSREHFENLKRYLNELSIPFEVNPLLVRGLDYYNETVFEIVSGELGAQNSISGGGRYDGLMKQLGGPDLTSIGFGAGLERLLQTMLKQDVPLPSPYQPQLFFIPMGDEAKKICFTLLHQLREKGVTADMDFTGKKVGKAMQHANALKAKFVAVVGENEIQSKEVDLKEMATGQIFKAPLFDLSRIFLIEQKGDDYIQLWNEMNMPFKNKLEAEFFYKKVQNSIEMTQKMTADLQDALGKIKTYLDQP